MGISVADAVLIANTVDANKVNMRKILAALFRFRHA